MRNRTNTLKRRHSRSLSVTQHLKGALVVRGDLLLGDSLHVLHPVLLLLVRQAVDFGGGGSGGPVIHSLHTGGFLQTKPAEQEKKCHSVDSLKSVPADGTFRESSHSFTSGFF